MANNTLDLSSITGELEDNLNVIFRRFVLGTFVRAQKKAPVDQGRFRSSINVSLNSPSNSQSTRENPSPLGGVDQIALAAATSTLDGFKLSVDRSIHVQSNLPYSEEIELGKSTQAPNGVFKASLREEIEAFNSYGNN